jgi:uncharacterized protein
MDESTAPLSPAEVRVLGSLVEKQVTTPDYYPLSLNALTNACNQLTNRDPVVAYDDQTVLRALDSLRDKRLATLFRGAESRVAKYKHTLTDAILLTPAEVAVLCILMLRGPQTVGELRTRTERLYRFEHLADVEETLNTLATREPPLVVKLPRQPGTKEARFAHLFSGPVDVPASEIAPRPEPPPPGPPDNDPVAKLEQDIDGLRRELAELRQQFADFRRQFE